MAYAGSTTAPVGAPIGLAWPCRCRYGVCVLLFQCLCLCLFLWVCAYSISGTSAGGVVSGDPRVWVDTGPLFFGGWRAILEQRRASPPTPGAVWRRGRSSGAPPDSRVLGGAADRLLSSSQAWGDGGLGRIGLNGDQIDICSMPAWRSDGL